MTARELEIMEFRFNEDAYNSIVNILRSVGGVAEFSFLQGLYTSTGVMWIDHVALVGGDINLYGKEYDVSYSYKDSGDNYYLRSDLITPSKLMYLIEEYISSSYGSTTDK